MKSAAWRVRGIGHEARETAREAARRAGMSLGQWLNAVIAESAGDVKGEGREEDLAVIHERLDDLILRLKEIARSGTEDAPHAEPRARDVSSEASLQALERRLAELAQALSRRRKQGPNRVADAVGRLNERLDQLIAEGAARRSPGGGQRRERRAAERRPPGASAPPGGPRAARA
jgi:localization factor PodJL